MPIALDDLRCVECGAVHLVANSSAIACPECHHEYPVEQGIPRLLPRNSALHRAAETVALVGDDLQAAYWHDDAHGFRPPMHPIVRHFAEQRWKYLCSKFDAASVKTALDVGCGDGFSTIYAPAHFHTTACDGSLTMLGRHPGPRRIQADAFVLPFRDASFDLVFAWELLHHVSEPWRVLAEMARVSRRWVISCEPNPLNPAQLGFALADRAHRWVLRFSRGYIARQFAQAGLEVRHFSRGGCLFPNKTPGWLFPLLKHVPYRLPLIGISSITIGERRR